MIQHDRYHYVIYYCNY